MTPPKLVKFVKVELPEAESPDFETAVMTEIADRRGREGGGGGDRRRRVGRGRERRDEERGARGGARLRVRARAPG